MSKSTHLQKKWLKDYETVLCLAVVSWLASLGYSILNQSALPPYVQELGLAAHIGVVFAAFLVMETVFKSPMGSLGDKLGRRPVIVAGALVSCIAALGIAVSQALWALIVLQAIDGLGCAAIWPTITAAMSGSAPPNRRTTTMVVMMVTYMSGLALGPLIGGLSNDLTDSRQTSFYVVAALFMITAAVAW
ncbi:MAG: MFS transporter, partial [Armatimonadetes bacterium]|nr:MFS transporter [Armatimonadota bacterium]